jgi:hypothetical protein
MLATTNPGTKRSLTTGALVAVVQHSPQSKSALICDQLKVQIFRSLQFCRLFLFLGSAFHLPCP